MSSCRHHLFWFVSFLLAVTSTAFTPRYSTRVTTTSASASTTVAMGASSVVVEERDSWSMSVSAPPTVLERPTVERRTTKDPTRDRKQQGNENWEVRIYNDGLNTREHVARSLVQVTGMSELIAYQTMMQAHQNGIAVVGRWVFEVAEMYHDELKRNGIVCDIVPVDEDSR